MSTPNSLTFNGWVTQVSALAIVDTTTVNSVLQFQDPRLQAAIPEILNYAELRIQRDVDLNALATSSSAYSTTAGNNVLSIPASDFVTIETMLINGAPVTFVSKAFIQNLWPTNISPGAPTYAAPYGGDQATQGQTSSNYLLGPWPDAIYPVQVTGVQRAPSLYALATQAQAATGLTWISTWLPDLLVTASMIFVSGLQRDFSPMGNDPQAPVNWETAYQGLLRGVQAEEARKRFAASAWSSSSQPVAATPTR